MLGGACFSLCLPTPCLGFVQSIVYIQFLFFSGGDDKSAEDSVLLPLLYVTAHFFLSHDTGNLLYFSLGPQRVTWQRTGIFGYVSRKQVPWSSESSLSESSIIPKVKCSKVLSLKYLGVAWKSRFQPDTVKTSLISLGKEKKRSEDEQSCLNWWLGSWTVLNT